MPGLDPCRIVSSYLNQLDSRQCSAVTYDKVVDQELIAERCLGPDAAPFLATFGM